jgi:hypothetical protein
MLRKVSVLQADDPLGALSLVVEAREFVVLDVLKPLMLADLENVPSVEDSCSVEEPLLDRAVKAELRSEGVGDRVLTELLAGAVEVV